MSNLTNVSWIGTRPTIFTDLAGMRGQECDRPVALATELAKVGAIVVATADYDTLYVWPFGVPEQYVSAWHRDNNAGDTLKFHIGHQIVTATMAE